MSPSDEVTVHQLLGRIDYFHTLFVEPAHAASGRPGVGEPCCKHLTASGHAQPDVGSLLADTAWAVLDELAATLGEHLLACPASDNTCCATCRVADSAAAIAQAWAITEHQAYDRPPPSAALLRACRSTAAAQLARVFAQQHETTCRPRTTSRTADTGRLPDSSELPLTGELLALWENPTAATHRPVVSWLNHCTELSDIHRLLQQRETTK
ncbi:hypothetical protein [Streptomyces lunaelactis]|uniref:hypothetical protein n=1 Tax=Streptomyces lunaelactis TaxID=1535768 RepID=UPI0015847770|nr:hypothetical protein [Streptomyces lunaelactis]NUK21939.1 hypothetical protein [Streptomyces lunaelactis]